MPPCFASHSPALIFPQISVYETAAMPMHPKCFELFKRVSQQKLGKVDIDGLWRLREVRPFAQHPVLIAFDDC